LDGLAGAVSNDIVGWGSYLVLARQHAGVFKGLPPSQGIGGRPKKRGCQARLHCATPPPPANTIGGGGRISREKCRFSCLRALIWRRGSL